MWNDGRLHLVIDIVNEDGKEFAPMTHQKKICAERELRHGKRKRADDGLTYAIRLEFGEHKPPRSVLVHS